MTSYVNVYKSMHVVMRVWHNNYSFFKLVAEINHDWETWHIMGHETGTGAPNIPNS